MALLTINNIGYFENEDFSIKGINFTQEHLQNIGIAGQTGSGKSTLLKMIGGLLQPTSGEILFENKKIIGPYDKLIAGNDGIAYLSQQFELLNNYRVHEVLDIANKIEQDKADNIYRICRIEHLLNRRTNQLSGGERQRIALAKALIGSPRLLLLDEPFSNLDGLHRGIIKLVINDLKEKLAISCIMVSHDASDILSWADQIIVLKDGEIIQRGTPEQIYRHPINLYCAGLFGDFNLVADKWFSKITRNMGFVPPGKQMLLRPEHVFFTTETATAVQGTIKRTTFWGSYFIHDILVEDQLIRMKTNLAKYKSGDCVYISFLAEDAVFL
jgi:iron(III) transport system ATP-binding protein